MDEVLKTHHIVEIIRAVELFLEGLEQVQTAYFRQANIAEKRDAWILKFDVLYKNETFGRELILHITIPAIEVKLISDEQIK